jgi:hypothetical protein
MTQLRFAEVADIPQLVELGREIHAQSRYVSLPYGAKHTWGYLERVIPSKQHCLIVAERDGELRGVLLASAKPYLFCAEVSAQIEVFYLQPTLRGTPVAVRMLAALRRWSENRDVAEIWMLDQWAANAERNKPLFERLGMAGAGRLRSRWVQRG